MQTQAAPTAAPPAFDVSSPWFIVPVAVAGALLIALVATCIVVCCCCDWRQGRRTKEAGTPQPQQQPPSSRYAPAPPQQPKPSARNPVAVDTAPVDDDYGDDDGGSDEEEEAEWDGTTAGTAQPLPPPPDVRLDVTQPQPQRVPPLPPLATPSVNGGFGSGGGAAASGPASAFPATRRNTPVEGTAPAAVRRPAARPVIQLRAPPPTLTGPPGTPQAPPPFPKAAGGGVGFTGSGPEAEVSDYRNPMLAGTAPAAAAAAAPRPGIVPRRAIQLVPRG